LQDVVCYLRLLGSSFRFLITDLPFNITKYRVAYAAVLVITEEKHFEISIRYCG